MLVAYKLALPPSFYEMHNVFHVSMLRKYLISPTHVVDYEPLQMDKNLSYEEKPVMILAHEVKSLRMREITFIRILWQNHQIGEATWKLENEMREKYPKLFQYQITREDKSSF